jgi:PAS domain S-box-containing protein
VISALDNWILAGALVLQMALIAGLLVERRRRRRASEALDERLRFETLLSDMSAVFTGPHAAADGVIRQWLERLVTYLDVDRAALIPVAPADQSAYGIVSFARPGVEASPAVITEEAWPWYIEQVRRGVTLNYPRILDELPPEAVREREYVRRVGMKSHLSVPINTGGQAICELAISTMRTYRTWPDDLIARLRVVGEIFAQALTRSEIERALREGEEQYRSVVEHQTELICRYLPDTTLTFVNDAYCRFWNKRREELIGTRFVELIPESARAAALRHVASIVERPREEGNEHQVLLPDGSIGWQLWFDRAILDVNGRVVELQGIGRDVTERRRAEDALRESQRRYALATSAGSVGVWDWNLDSGEIYVDPLLKALLGFDDDEVGGRREDWTRLVHPDDLPLLLSRLQEHLEGRTPAFEIEHRMLHKDGSVRWFLARGAVVGQAGPGPLRVIGTNTDITGRRQAEEALRQARVELAHAGRLSALGELSASIAHELGQPLAAIMSNAQAGLNLLRRTAPSRDELEEILRDIAKDDERAGEIIRRMGALLRKRQLETQPVDMNELVRETVRIVAADAAARDVQITCETAAALPTLQGDKVHLQQVVLNLLLNGMEALAAVPPSERRLFVHTTVRDGEVQLAVIDTGPGIPPELLRDIFEPFCSTKRDGMGIGLSIARSIVEAHGGRIMAENGPTGGATVRFALPIVGELVSPPPESLKLHPQTTGPR